MDIVICTDNNYVMPAGVLICSICENNKTEKIKFHIIGDNTLSEKNKQSLLEEIQHYHQEVSFYCADSSLNYLLPVGHKDQLQHITVAAYYRLFLANILPNEINKILYLDCDIIVRYSLKELWDTDITNYAVGCVADQCESLILFYNRLKYPQALGYFNSGVLLINLAYWRKYNLQNEYLFFLKKHPDRVVNHDQDILNYILRNKKKALPLKYNVQNGFLCNQLQISWEYEKDLEEAINKPYIIHYLDRIKPWMKGCDHPFKSEFFKYRQLTQWKNTPLQKCKVKLPIKKRIRYLLSKLGLVSKHYDYRNDLKLSI